LSVPEERPAVPCVSRTTVSTSLVALAALGLTACSGGDGQADSQAAVSSGNPATCPGDVVDVVVSVSQWTDVVRKLGGDCATVTTVVSSGAVDPHDFEPSTADLAAFSEADLVVLNGADYDHWAEDAVATLDREPPVVNAAEVAGIAEESHNTDTDTDTDPHLWYSPEVVIAMADAVAEELGELSPDAAPYFEGQQVAWSGELRPYLDAVTSLNATVRGRTYAATETVFDRMATTLGLSDVTPAGYRRSASNESDPAPGDLAEFEAALADGRVDVLIYNAQTSGSVPEQLRAAAEDADVPVVEVTESPEEADGSFVAWQLAQLQELAEALSAIS
jgi:zinc/manganese transport system substrate-binding protein